MKVYIVYRIMSNLEFTRRGENECVFDSLAKAQQYADKYTIYGEYEIEEWEVR
jgi:hypothetical protein